jgi:hypothetical protein
VGDPGGEGWGGLFVGQTERYGAILPRLSCSGEQGPAQGLEEPASGIAVELIGLWIDPELEERAEVACCLLYFLLQCLVGNDAISSLEQGATSSSSRLKLRLCDRYINLTRPVGRGGGGSIAVEKLVGHSWVWLKWECKITDFLYSGGLHA